MGDRALAKKKFLAEHPVCCFCGGDREAEEPDHIPSKSMFLNRQWPEGFIFPACVECNRETRYDEEIVAFLSRAYPDPQGNQEAKEFTKLCESLNKYRPDIITEMNGTASMRKKAARSYNIAVPDGRTTRDLPLLHIGPLVHEAVINFSRKLILALYYKHSTKILRHEAGIAIRWYSNIEISRGAIPEELNQHLTGYTEIIRCNTNLDDQFSYRYAFSECRRMAIFLVFFRLSFAIVGAVNLEPDKFDLPEIAKILRPYERG